MPPVPSGAPVVLLVAGRDPIEERAGGHSAYVRAHGHALLRAGFSPHLFGLSRSAGPVETPFGVVHRLRTRLPRRQLLAMVHGGRLARAIARFARTRPGPHVVHGFGVWGQAGALAARALARRGVEAVALTSGYTAYADESGSKAAGVAAAHGLLHRARFLGEHLWIRLAVERYERDAYEGARRVLVNYDSVRAMLVRRYRVGGKVRRVAYASPLAFEAAAARPRPPSDPSEPPLVVSVSRHEPRKGVNVLLDALAILRRGGAAFRAVVASEGPLLAAHRRLAERLGLSDAAELPGLVPDTGALLAAADVYVLPSLREQSGSLALLEALGAGVAVVATACDGIPEDVADGETALLVPPGDAPALAAAIRRLLDDPALRRRLGAAGRALFEARFSAQALVDALRAQYAELGVPLPRPAAPGAP